MTESENATESPAADPTQETREITVEQVTASQPNRKWHDRKWLLVTITLIGGLLLGILMAAPDRTLAEKEGDKIVADAKEERDEILADANDERDELLGDVESDREEVEAEVKELTSERERLTSQRTAITGQVRALKKELGKLEREKAMGTFEGDGIYLVGSDIMTGTYKAAASPSCYYAILRDLSGSFDNIITNGNVDGPVVIEVTSSAKAVEVQRCGTFTRVG